ncbi:MAG TPA: hypothetical protein DCZ30_06705 [Clostridiales bacterium]|nr:hypothetical protein [Clostridiales bacterium]
MKKTEFDKKIKIIPLANNDILAFELKSILYTPNKYRIPVAFADTTNSADDTEQYIFENYTIEEQEKLKHNDIINNQFLAEMSKVNSDSEDEIKKIVNKYKAQLLDVNYKAPDELRSLCVSDDIENMKGYFVIDSNAIIGNNGELLSNFLNLDFNNFNHFFMFFTKYFGMFIDCFEERDLESLKIDELTDMKLIISLANKIYESSKNHIINVQNLFKEFVTLLYGYDNNKDMGSLTLKQKFYVFTETNKKELQTFSEQYQHYGFFNFDYVHSDLIHLEHNNTSELISKLKQFDPDGSKILNSYSIVTDNIYTVLYISLYNLVLNNNAMIRQCKNCHRYFLTNKSNTYYCDNIYYENKTCKDVGNQLSQKRKESKEPIYGKYRSIYANKATLLKRYPDIYSQEDYDKWKREAKQFMNDIRHGLKTYDEFDKWLDKNK